MNPPEHLCESERDTHGERWREIERAQGEDKRRKLIEKKKSTTRIPVEFAVREGNVAETGRKRQCERTNAIPTSLRKLISGFWVVHTIVNKPLNVNALYSAICQT